MHNVSTNEFGLINLEIGNDATISGSMTGINWGTQIAETNANLAGNGTTSSPLKIAQHGATGGQVLKWDGSTWLPGTDMTGSSFWAQSMSNIYYTNSSYHMTLDKKIEAMSTLLSEQQKQIEKLKELTK